MCVLEGNNPGVLNFGSLCSNWNGAMSFILSFFPQSIISCGLLYVGQRWFLKENYKNYF